MPDAVTVRPRDVVDFARVNGLRPLMEVRTLCEFVGFCLYNRVGNWESLALTAYGAELGREVRRGFHRLGCGAAERCPITGLGCKRRTSDREAILRWFQLSGEMQDAGAGKLTPNDRYDYEEPEVEEVRPGEFVCLGTMADSPAKFGPAVNPFPDMRAARRPSRRGGRAMEFDSNEKGSTNA